MTVKTNATGAKRKELVNDIANWLGVEPSYCGAPTFAYKVGTITISKDGTMEFPLELDSQVAERLLEHLYDSGFEIDMSVPETAPDTDETEETGIAIQMPASSFTETSLQNLYNLVEAKGNLIKKALGRDSLPINNIDGRIDFPWFPHTENPDEVKTYMHFITALCEMARTQKRITAKEKEVENEKYAFRCFLLRLGFIGEEYKTERKILLRNLQGSSAFKSGSKKEVDA